MRDTDVDRKGHWDRIYRTKAPSQLTWFEPRPETSLRLIEAAGLGPDARILDVGGGTSTLVDCLLDAGYRNLGVLDVSPEALETSRLRLGERAAQVQWIEADVTQYSARHSWDLWHDRVVLHFLTDPDDVLAYRRSMLEALSADGQAVIATFGPKGPTKCSGLEVQRYDSDSLQEALGSRMELADSLLEEHLTPTGATQQFLFCRFRRA